MNRVRLRWLSAVLLTLAALCGRAQAAGVGSPSYLNIDVSITNNLSVSVSAGHSSTMTVTWTGTPTILAGSTATVTNDSGYISERWELSSTANSWDSVTGNAGWTIASTVGTDQVKVQAVFGASGMANSCAAAASWANTAIVPALTSATQTPYTATILADTGLGTVTPDNAVTNRMNSSSSRGLCWRLSMPTSTSVTGTQVVPVIVTAF